MRRSPVLVAPLALLLAAPAHAGKEPKVDPDHANHFTAEPVSTEAVTVTPVYAWARMLEAKVKVRLANRSDDPLLVLRDAATLSMDAGAFHPPAAPGRFEVVEPAGEVQLVYRFEPDPPDEPPGGPEGMHLRSMSLSVDGVRRVRPAAGPLDAPDLTLPLNARAFDVGPFACEVKGKPTQKTDRTQVAFRCTYRGEEGTVGVIDARRITVATPDGQAFANEGDPSPDWLLPGDTATFKVRNTVIQPAEHGYDMQFTRLSIDLDPAFSTATLEPVAVPPLVYALDEATTAAKN